MSDRSEANGDSHITIPPKALEAAVRGIARLRPNPYATNEDVAHAACHAMLRNWPGMRVSMLFPPDVLHVVLPITQENENE